MKKWIRMIGLVSLASWFCLANAALSSRTHPQPPSLAERPPQFVMLAFDGSLDLDFWAESRDFARKMKSQGTPLQWTYFISGTYFLAQEKKAVYIAPKQGPGKSAIGFGGSLQNLPLRAEQVNEALEEGHEIGSHANGHFDAQEEKWSEQDWVSEFNQFNHLIFDLFSINSVKPVRPEGWVLKQQDLIGFRAPQLGTTEGLWPTLVNFGYRYDTSNTAEPNTWPTQNIFGTWSFPLALIPIVGTAKKCLSMDYNFYIAQSSAAEVPAQKELYRKQMLDSYLKYFHDNYDGNRAPIHIGHHFSKWNGGAYWEALQQFATSVCRRPEVRCVTYKEYVVWLESLDPATLKAYRKGNFEHSTATRLASVSAAENQIPDLNLSMSLTSDGRIQMVRSGPGDFLKGLKSVFTIQKESFEGTEMNLAQLRARFPIGSNLSVTAHLYDRKGIELIRATQRFEGMGTNHEKLDSGILESRALLGDLPEAHYDEKE